MRFEFLTAMLLRIQDFWDMTLCHVVSGSQHFEGSWCIHLDRSCSHSPKPLNVNSGMSETTHPTIQLLIPEDLNSQSVSVGEFDMKHN
jgi:hypothetical protein